MRHYPDIVLRLIQFHTSERSRIKYRMRKRRERVKYFQHSRRNFVSPSGPVVVYILDFLTSSAVGLKTQVDAVDL